MLTDEQRKNVQEMFSTATGFNGQALRDFTRKAAGIILDLEKENAALKERRDELLAAMHRLVRLGNGDKYGNSEGSCIAIAAIAKTEGVK